MEKLKKGFKKNPLIWTSILCWVIGFPASIILSDIFKILIWVPFILFPIWLFILIPINFFRVKGSFSKKISVILAKTGIQWLLLIIVVGIFIAVGFFGFFSPWHYGKQAQIHVTKVIHNSVVISITADLQACKIGDSSIMDGTRSCSGITASNFIDAAINFRLMPYNDRNAFDTSKWAIRKSDNNTKKEDLGFISLSASGSDIIIKSCNKTPCNKEANRNTGTVSIK